MPMITGYVDRGVPRVKIHLNSKVQVIMTLRHYDEIKNRSLQIQEVSRLIKTIVDAPRISQVLTGDKVAD